jgi:hypothetical protein
MLALLTKVWNGVKSLAALVVPVFDKAGAWRHVSHTLRWVIHLVLVAALVVLLHFLNRWFDVGRYVGQKPFLNDNFLPIVFVLLYALAWLAWALYRLLVPEAIDSDFPDIDAAWDEALAALRQAGVGLTDVPLFLVLGEAAGGEQALFKAAFATGQRPLRVAGAPAGRAPLHVYATPDGIWVTCPGASLTGEQSRRLATGEEPGAGVVVPAGQDGGLSTMAPGGRLQDVQVVLGRARKEQRELTDAEQAEIRQLMGQEQSEHTAQVRGKRPPLLRETATVDRLAARLGHLCRLIDRDRKPYCPINGILLLVPWAATDTDDDAGQTAEVVRTDLAALRAHLRVLCPTFALVCDLEGVPGFREFLQHVPEKDRQRRVGQRFPLAPEVAGDGPLKMIDGGLQWICAAMFPSWVSRCFHLEGPGQEDLATATRVNTRLYQAMFQLLERQRRLSRVLTRGLVHKEGEPLLFGGCYLGATGPNPAGEQAFVPGVLQRLLDEQNNVSWTGEALDEDATYRRRAQLGNLALGGFAVLVVLIAALLLFAGGSSAGQ